MSALDPIADKMLRCRECPLCAISGHYGRRPLMTASANKTTVSSAGATDRARGDRLCNRDSGHFRRASGLYAVSRPDLAWGDIENIAPLAAL